MPLDIARTLSIGLSELVGVRQQTLFGNFNIHEFNLLVLRADVFWQNLGISGFTLHQLLPNTWANFKDRYSRRISEILEWVSDGHTLVVVPHVFPRLRLMDGQIIEESMNDYPPFNLVILENSVGELVEIEDEFKDTLGGLAPIIRYDYILTGQNLTPALRTSSARQQRSRTVGGICRVGNGAVVFAPPLKNWSDARLPAYLGALSDIRQLLDRVPGDAPDWSSRFQSPTERAAASRISELDRQAAELHRLSNEQKAIVEAEERLKLLYSGTDHDLVSIVALALRELGLAVVEGPRARADLVFWDGKRLAAAEVKGLDGTARERNHRQAERWAADVNATLVSTPEDRTEHPELEQYAEKLLELGLAVDKPVTDIECRGVMIIGTHRQIPLDQRPVVSFPDPVARAIARSNVCALTGLDLYCVLQEVRVDPGRTQAIVDTLLSSKGVMSTKDWRAFITAG